MHRLLLFDFANVLLFRNTTAVPASLAEAAAAVKSFDQATFDKLFSWNQELLDVLAEIKRGRQNKNGERKPPLLAVFSNSGHMLKTEPVQTKLQPLFDELIAAGEFGYSKHDPEAFKALAKRFNVAAEELLFIDDSERNVAAAEAAGCDVIHFIQNESCLQKLESILDADG